MSENKLIRSEDRMVAGVAAGLANYFNIDPVIVRFLFVMLTILTTGWWVVVYVILALVMRNDPYTDAKYYAFDEEEIVLEDEIIIKEVKD